MRISTAASYESSIDNIMRRQVELADSQDRLTSGLRVARASDDPEAAARAERALATENRTVSSQRAVDASRAAMQQAESALSHANDLLTEARAVMVESGNGTYTDSERKILAGKLQSLRGQLLQVANRQGADGTYLFSSQGASFPPFLDQPPAAGVPPEQTGVTFKGVPGTIRTEQGTGLPLSADGYAAFVSARTGNGVFETRADPSVAGAWIDAGRVVDPSALQDAVYDISFSVVGGVTTYSIDVTQNIAGAPTNTAVNGAVFTPGQAITIDGMAFIINGTPANGNQFQIVPSTPQLSVFGALDKAIQELNTSSLTVAQRNQHTAENLRNIDSVMSNLLSARSESGEVLNRIDSEVTRLADQKYWAQTERSLAQDLDIPKAISEFQVRQAGYDAALKSYAMVQKLSLFQYVSG